MSNHNLSTKIKIDFDVELEKSYSLVIHNDDTTPFELVIYVLCTFCDKSQMEALSIAQYVHMNGKKKVMNGSKEYLDSKMQKCLAFAREYGFNDFKMTVEEE
jgi:ATP-dependent Clp protease adapter protein ClpS